MKVLKAIKIYFRTKKAITQRILKSKCFNKTKIKNDSVNILAMNQNKSPEINSSTHEFIMQPKKNDRKTKCYFRSHNF